MFEDRQKRVFGKAQQGRGFTLVELMIVLVIIGILMAILVPRIPDVLWRAKMTQACQQVMHAGRAWCLWRPGSQNSNMGPGVQQPSPILLSELPNVLSHADILVLEQHLDVVLPTIDPWGNRVEYLTDVPVPSFPPTSSDELPEQLMVRVTNRNGVFDEPYYWQTIFPIADKQSDIVWLNCDWVQMPKESD